MVSKESVNRPLITIGVPVYNGEKHLEEALTSLLNQSMSDFEIIISDNASTDGTRSISEKFVSRDKRIRYLRQNNNIGAPRNWNILVEEASGLFFKWASANDYCSKTMIEQCVKELQSDSDTVLCYGRTLLVDDNGLPLKVYEREISLEENRPSDRFERICSNILMNNMQSGVFRLDTLRHTRLDRYYPSGDLSLMEELALHGRFKLLPDVLLYRRISRNSFSSKLPPLELQRLYDPNAKKPIKLICNRRHLDRIISIANAPISVTEKLRAYRVALKFIRWDRLKIAREWLSLFHCSEAYEGDS